MIKTKIVPPQNVFFPSRLQNFDTGLNTVQRKVLRWITMRILFLWRWEWIVVTYNLSHRTSEAVSDYYRRTEVLSFRLGVLLVAFHG